MFQITKIQNKTNSTLKNLKFTKQTQNNLGIAGKAFCNCKNSDGRFLDTGTMAACLLYVRPPQKRQATGEIYNGFLPSSLSSPAVTCNNKKTQAIVFILFF
jgi:hypothetical protein